MSHIDISSIAQYTDFDINLFSVITELSTETSNTTNNNSIEDLFLTTTQVSNINNIYSYLLHYDLPNEMLENIDEEEQTTITEKGRKNVIHMKYCKKQNIGTCPITLKDFVEGCDIIKLPCSHIFDADAIMQWLENHISVCPLCRYNVNQI